MLGVLLEVLVCVIMFVRLAKYRILWVWGQVLLLSTWPVLQYCCHRIAAFPKLKFCLTLVSILENLGSAQ